MRLFVISAIFIALLFFNHQSAHASNDYPTGCIINYHGETRVYTDYKFTDTQLCRHYSLKTDYVIDHTQQEISVSYTSPYKGTCSVDGATKGSNVIISSIEKPVAADRNYLAPILVITVLSLLLGAFTVKFYFLKQAF